MPEKKENPDLLPPAALLGLTLQLGFAVATAGILFTFGGWWLDQKFDTSPIFFWLGVMLGLMVSMVIVWQIIKPIRDQLNAPTETLEKPKKDQ